jgi:ribosomal protein S6--L-glutamate ligase
VNRRVCAVVEAGDAPGRNPLLPPLATELRRRGIELVVWDPTRAVDLPPAAPAADLYLLKADDLAALSAAGCLHDAGAGCLNDYEATAAAHDKGRMLARLARAGLPVPASSLIGSREALSDALAAGRRFVKPLLGAHGDGVRILAPGEANAAGEAPWLVQEPVGAVDGIVLKVYGVRERVAVRRMSFQPGVVDALREPVEPDQELVRLATLAAEAAGLVCFGSDFIITDDGPVLVDVNAFPGYRSVPEAPRWIADEIESALA